MSPQHTTLTPEERAEAAVNVPDLRAVLFLDGPAQLMTFVCDVRRPTVDVAGCFGMTTRCYALSRSDLGPEGWGAAEDPNWKLVKS